MTKSKATLLASARSVAAKWYEPRRPDPGPDWEKWRNMAELELWQAVLLSCGIEPVDVNDPDNEYVRRLQIAMSHLSPRGMLAHVAPMKRRHLASVTLADVERLAEQMSPPWKLPPAMTQQSQIANVESLPGTQRAAPTGVTEIGSNPGASSDREAPIERRQRLHIEHEQLKAEGCKNPTETLADREGISSSRLRRLLRVGS